MQLFRSCLLLLSSRARTHTHTHARMINPFIQFSSRVPKFRRYLFAHIFAGVADLLCVCARACCCCYFDVFSFLSNLAHTHYAVKTYLFLKSKPDRSQHMCVMILIMVHRCASQIKSNTILRDCKWQSKDALSLTNISAVVAECKLLRMIYINVAYTFSSTRQMTNQLANNKRENNMQCNVSSTRW